MFPTGAVYISGILISYLIVAVIISLWIIRSGETFKNRKVDHSILIRKYLTEISWIALLSFVAIIAGGFLTYQDSVWHQLSHSANEQMPARTIIFTHLYPAYIIFGGSAWLYARTHFPEEMSLKMNVAFFVATLAPFSFLPTDDPDMLNLSTDLYNVSFRVISWVLMLMWIIAISYLVLRFCRLILGALEHTREDN